MANGRRRSTVTYLKLLRVRTLAERAELLAEIEKKHGRDYARMLDAQVQYWLTSAPGRPLSSYRE